MDSRKIQKSGTTYYLYLPAAWCREHNISTNSTVYLEKSSQGNLVIHPKKSETTLKSLKLDLLDNNTEVINKVITAAFINPVKAFKINLKENLNPDQILGHKKLLGGLELIDFEENAIVCHTSLALSDPDNLLSAIIKKMLNIVHLLKKDKGHELIAKYEEEIDKTNLLIHKSIIASLMYKRESKIRHINLFYIGLISRNLEQITDILITVNNNDELIDTIEYMLNSLLTNLDDLNLAEISEFIKNIDKLEKIEVMDLESYKTKRVYSLFGHISEILCDWLITDNVDK